METPSVGTVLKECFALQQCSHYMCIYQQKNSYFVTAVFDDRQWK